MVKVLIVDDSVTMRQFLTREISKAPDMEVVGTADNPYTARDKIINLHPDVVTLDIEMPNMDGLTFLGKLMRYYPIPVVVVSSYSTKGTDIAMRALDLGAVDVFGKPGPQCPIKNFGKILVDRLREASQASSFVTRQVVTRVVNPERHGPVLNNSAYKILAIGASIGGTEAIRELLVGLPNNSPSILIVQHLPEMFTKQFVKRLNDDCDLEVCVAESGIPLRPGLALVSPGDKHLILSRKGSQYYSEIRSGPSVHGHCPSVEVLFHSVATSAGPDAIGVLLTGMGADGAQGLLAMRQAGARTIVQDEKSCVVWGMPKAAIDLGAAEKVMPLSRMASEIFRYITLDVERPLCHTVTP